MVASPVKLREFFLSECIYMTISYATRHHGICKNYRSGDSVDAVMKHRRFHTNL